MLFTFNPDFVSRGSTDCLRIEVLSIFISMIFLAKISFKGKQAGQVHLKGEWKPTAEEAPATGETDKKDYSKIGKVESSMETREKANSSVPMENQPPADYQPSADEANQD